MTTEVKKEFELSYRESEIIRNAFATLEAKKATYKTANEFAIEISDEDVDRFENVADIVAYLEKKLAK